MIGQKDLHKKLEKIFPQFIIIVGPKGSGRKKLIKERYGGSWVEDIGVQSIRNMIQSAYKVRNTIFVIPDADTMSLTAKNAMLKVVEECPNRNTFIMTLEDLDNTLDTIKSRATVFYMDNYSEQELNQFCDSCLPHQLTEKEQEIAVGICDTPGEILSLYDMGILDFYNYVKKVLDNIDKVSGANSFKIADNISLKKDAEGYDLILFWKTVCRICFDMVGTEEQEKYVKAIYITSSYVKKCRYKTFNRQMLMDEWILDVRKAWS